MKLIKQSFYAAMCMFLIFGQVTTSIANTLDSEAVRDTKVLDALKDLLPDFSEAKQLKNVAQGKTATQSSTVFGAVASRAVDGNTFGRWSGRSVTHTALDGVDPWWQVDLGGLYDISEIKIFKRSDCCLQVFDNFRILYSDRPIDSSAKEYVGLQRATNATFHSFKKSAKKVRYVRITLKGKTPLYMAEVQVFGVPANTATTTSGSIVTASSVEYAQTSSNRLKFTRTGPKTWRQGPVGAKIKWTETKRDSTSIYLSRRTASGEQKSVLNLQSKKVRIYNTQGSYVEFAITNVTGEKTETASRPKAKKTTPTRPKTKTTTLPKPKTPSKPSNVAEVKFFSRNNLTLAQAQSIAAQNDWELATQAQVKAAWQSKGLNAFAYGRTSDGKFCVPIQQDNGGIKRGANCGVTGGNQGFLYVKKIPEVKFYSRVNLTLAQAQNIAAEKGWQIATPAQVTSAWENGGLNAFAYGRTSDGGFCIPIQQDNGGFKRGTNCGVTGGNQGFLYVPVSAANAADVSFYPKSNVTLTQARNIARRYGWKIATPAQVEAAWKYRGLHEFAYGRTSDGKFCVPIQQLLANFKKGANCGLTGGNQGFLYVNPDPAVRSAKRTTYIDIAGSGAITGPPRTIGTKYAGRYLHLVWNKSVQHPAQRVFGMGDAVMLRKAATLMLRTQKRSTSNASVNTLLDSLRRNASARYRFAPYLLKVTFDALATKRPDAGQLAFRKNFGAYMGRWRFEQSLDTLHRWNSFKRENERSQFDPNKYNQGPTAGNFLPMRPADVPKFLATHTNPMLLGNKGRSAIRLLLEPAAAASLPQFRNDRLARVGADMDAVTAGIGVGTTLGTSAATIGLVSSAVLSGTGVIGVSSTVVGATTTASGAAVPITNTAATYGPMKAVLLKSGKLAGFSLGGAAAIGIAIAIAMAVVIGIAIARQAISDQLDRRLKSEFNRGFDPIDVHSLVNARSASRRGVNRSAVFGYLLKMLIADPAENGMLSLQRPDPRTVGAGLPRPGVVKVQHKGAYVSDVTLSYLDANKRLVRVVRNSRPIGQVDRFDIPGEATQVRLSIVMYTGLAGSAGKVTLINRVLRKDELRNKCFTTVGTTIVGRGLKEGYCEN